MTLLETLVAHKVGLPGVAVQPDLGAYCSTDHDAVRSAMRGGDDVKAKKNRGA